MNDSQSQKQTAQATARSHSASLFSPAPYFHAKAVAINTLTNDSQRRTQTTCRGTRINTNGTHNGPVRIVHAITVLAMPSILPRASAAPLDKLSPTFFLDARPW
jgi:hypothetical protein